MAKKNTAEVLINGKIYVISGYESTAYLQKVAAYLNEMEEKVTAMDGYRRLGSEEKQLLKNMNLADEYFKASDAKEQLERELENRDKEIYGLKHDLIDAKLEQEKLTERKSLPIQWKVHPSWPESWEVFRRRKKLRNRPLPMEF